MKGNSDERSIRPTKGKWPLEQCQCNFRIKILGEGCMYCNPARWEDILSADEDEKESP